MGLAHNEFMHEAAALPDPLSRRHSDWLCVLVMATFTAGCQPASSPPPSTNAQAVIGNALQGQRLLAQYQCGSCHSISGVLGAKGTLATPLDDFSQRSYIAGKIPNEPEALAAWIAQPHALIATTTMPDLAVSPQDARDMAAYLWARP